MKTKIKTQHPSDRVNREMLTYREIQDYVSSLVPARPQECQRMEQIARKRHFPIIGAPCGHLCYMIAKMIGARRIFELGSGFGYSTYWFARAVKENGGGVVHHTVWDEELSARAREHLTRLRMNNLVKFHIGEAIETLRGIDEEFDLLFCDIDKHAYAEALTEMNRHLRVGGVVIFDNMLLHGSVLPARRDSHVPPPHPSRNIDAARHKEHHAGNLRGVLKTTNMLFKKANWTASLIPLRDGLAMAMKSGN